MIQSLADTTKKRSCQPQKLFIEGLPPSEVTKESELRTYFSYYGTVIDCKVLKSGDIMRQQVHLRLRDTGGGRKHP